MFFLTLASLTGWAQSWRRWAQNPALDPAWTMFTMACMITTLYLAGWFGFLRPGAFVFMGVGLLLFAREVYFLWRTQKWTSAWSPGLAFFLISGVFFWLRYRHAGLYSWDEFVWGIVSKDLFFRNALYVKESAIVFKDYPPGSNLAHYFFFFTGRYSEGLSYTAAYLIFASALAVLFDMAPRRLWILGLLLVVAFYLKAGIGAGLQTLLVDDVIGAFFGGALVLSVFVLKSPRQKLLLIPILATLLLLKTIGTVLVGILLMITFVMSIFDASVERRSRVEWIRLMGSFLALVLAAGAIHFSWGMWKASIGAGQTVAYSNLTWPGVQRALLGEGSHREQVVLKGFVGGLWNSQFGHWYRRFFWCLLVAVILAPKRIERWRTSVLFASLSVGWALFLFVHLFVYLFLFSDYEAMELISYERYQTQFSIAFYIVCVGVILSLLQRQRKVATHVLLGAFILLLPFKTEKNTDLFSRSVRSSQERAQLQKFVKMAEDKIPPGSHVWVIFQHSTGIEKMILAYDLAPNMVNFWSWSLGAPFGPEDVWTTGWTPAEWERNLLTYNYVIVGKPNEDFWTRYQSLFEARADLRDKTLFRVEKSSDGQHIQLKAVE